MYIGQPPLQVSLSVMRLDHQSPLLLPVASMVEFRSSVNLLDLNAELIGGE